MTFYVGMSDYGFRSFGSREMFIRHSLRLAVESLFSRHNRRGSVILASSPELPTVGPASPTVIPRYSGVIRFVIPQIQWVERLLTIIGTNHFLWGLSCDGATGSLPERLR